MNKGQQKEGIYINNSVSVESFRVEVFRRLLNEYCRFLRGKIYGN
jgi:hypothetical protein